MTVPPIFPTDFLEARHLYIDSDTDNEIVPAPLDTFRRQYPTSLAGRPQIYAIAAGRSCFAPSPDTTYTAELHYYQKLDPLSSDNESNWLLSTNPDVYLYGALMMAEAFMWDDRVSRWKSAWDEAIDSLKKHGTKKRHGGGPLAIPGSLSHRETDLRAAGARQTRSPPAGPSNRR
jgi:hypothetical protein